MVRHGAAAEQGTAARSRLAALRLRTETVGWVPEPASEIVADRAVESLEVALPLPVWPPAEPAPSVASSGAGPAVAEPAALGDVVRAWAVDRMPPWTHAMVERARLGAVVVGVGVMGVAILSVVVLLHHGSSGGYSSSYDPSGNSSTYSPSSSGSQAPTAPIAATDATSIVVDVGGRVRKPGLVTLPAGARVADAIAAAGGPLHHSEIATLNLAARVTDGQLLLVGVKGADAGTSGDPGDSAGGDDSSTAGTATPVDLDSATLTELEGLPGVGPVTAQKILDWRSAHSGFTEVEQLQQIPGIGPAKYAEISPLVTP
jgi:competence protein ComEA